MGSTSGDDAVTDRRGSKSVVAPPASPDGQDIRSVDSHGDRLST